MSGLNPAAAAAAAAANAAEAAVALELQALAQDAQALRAMLMTGDIVQATVQPFNGVTDTLEIFGLRVAAALPSNVFPGDTLTVAVQGFNGDQVLVQVMSRTPSSSSSTSASTAGAQTVTTTPPQPASTAPAPVNTVSTASDTVELTRMPIPVVVDEALLPPLTPARQPPSQPATTSSASSQTEETDDEQTPSSPTTAAPPARPVMPQAPRVLPQANAPANADTLSVEARLALTRAATPGTLRAPIPPPPSATRGATTVPPPRPGAAAQPGAPGAPAAARANVSAPSSFTIAAARAKAPAPPNAQPIAPRTPFAPIITMRTDAAKPLPQPIPGAPAQARPTTTIPPSQTRVTVPTAEELLNDPTQLLRALRIPVTPTTQTFAKLVIAQPEQVATALSALEQGLPSSDDPRISTLRTLAAFVGTLDPESPTFTTQVTSYLTHVIEGPEQKLLTLAQPPEAQPAPSAPAETAPAQSETTPQTQAPAQTPVQTAPAVEDATTAAARVATSVAASDADLKTQLVALLSSAQPENTLGETGVVVARNALTALVASQLSTLASQQAQPGSWTFTVPITVDQQLYPAKIQISRDAPEEGKQQQLTGDDFHIAFILDTKRFGTIGIDLHAVQRSVSVTVRTERPSAATTFKSALAKLGDRLQSMKYNVKALDAHTTRVKEVVESNAPPPADTLRVMDNKA